MNVGMNFNSIPADLPMALSLSMLLHHYECCNAVFCDVIHAVIDVISKCIVWQIWVITQSAGCGNDWLQLL